MQSTLTHEQIIEHVKLATKDFAALCRGVDDINFFRQPDEKWSIAQNVTHLVTSANMTKLAYRLPKFIIRWYTGKPNRGSRTYDELVEKYKTKLAKGGKASGRFVAKPVAASIGKENIMRSFNRSTESLCKTMLDRWNDPQLDQYLAPHPLLGKLTLRELGYFTIYHTLHHLTIVEERTSEF